MPSSPSTLRYLCHVAVGVVVAALVVRTWVVLGLIVPVQVAAGSMAPTLLGPHVVVDCPNCGFRSAYGVDGLADAPNFACPHCLTSRTNLAGLPTRSGQNVYVNRLAWLADRPGRWSPVVFHCPDQANHLCVKRIVGLPGETIELRGGDVYIDGRIERKTLEAVRALALLVHDSTHTPQSNAEVGRGWRGLGADSPWEQRGDVFVVDPKVGSVAADTSHWLIYDHRGPILDDYPYNVGATRRLNATDDLRVTGRFKLEPASRLRLRIIVDAEPVDVTIDPAASEVALYRAGRVVARTATTIAPAEFDVEYSVFDRQAILAIDSAAVLIVPLESPTERIQVDGDAPSFQLAIGGQRGLQAGELRVWRDVYYTNTGLSGPHWAIGQPYEAPAGSYFVLGDNSPISLDSRCYPQGAVSETLLIGTPLGVP